MKEQSKTDQAENSLDALGHAVDQAESHPSENKLEEADSALSSANMAVRQAAGSGGGQADELRERLQAEKAALEGTSK